MKLKLILIFIFLFIISCSKSSEYQVRDSQEITGIINYINGSLKINKETAENKDIVLLYLILKECNCIYENVDFIKEFLKSTKLDKKIFLIVKPGDTERYTKEMTELNLLKSEKFDIIVDTEDEFLSHGNFYVTDKIFIIEKYKTIKKIELKKENFKIILQELI